MDRYFRRCPHFTEGSNCRLRFNPSFMDRYFRSIFA